MTFSILKSASLSAALAALLVSGKVDMIAACITITEERAKSVLFSEPYYTGGIAALVRE